LFNIAKRKDISIFVDNLFLFRKEITNIQVKSMDRISFYWNKPEIRESFFDSLLYHDLYLLLEWGRSDKWKVTGGHVFDNGLFLSMSNSYQKCCFEYHIQKTNAQQSDKWIIIDNYTLDLSCPKNDPLEECIVNMLQGNTDYDLSKKITLDTLKLMNNIKKQL